MSIPSATQGFENQKVLLSQMSTSHEHAPQAMEAPVACLCRIQLPAYAGSSCPRLYGVVGSSCLQIQDPGACLCGPKKYHSVLGPTLFAAHLGQFGSHFIWGPFGPLWSHFIWAQKALFQALATIPCVEGHWLRNYCYMFLYVLPYTISSHCQRDSRQCDQLRALVLLMHLF